MMKEHTPSCRDCIAQGKSIFKCLVGSQTALIDGEKTPHEYQRGQIIFYEGNPAFAVYCIFSGAVKIYKTLHNGEQRVIRLLGPQQIMGYRAVFADEYYGATAQAVDRSLVCTIPKSALSKLLHQSHDLTLQFLSKVSVELRISEEQMLSLTEHSVKQRLAQLLLSLSGHDLTPTKEPLQIKSFLSRSEMAQMIGTTPETLSRTLHELAARGVVQLHEADLYVSDISKLQRIANGMNNGIDINQVKS